MLACKIPDKRQRVANPPVIVATEGAAGHYMVCVACKTPRVMMRSTVSVACKTLGRVILRCTVHLEVP